MAISGIFTNIAIVKSKEVIDNEGFHIYPSGFGVSRTQGPLNPTRTTPNAGLWYQGIISSREIVSDNTLKFICTVPPGVIPPETTDTIREVYLFGQDQSFTTFLMAIGHAGPNIVYDPTGSVTLELELSLSNVDFTEQIVFAFTQAFELAEHNTDPNAHPELIQAVNKAGIFLKSGGVPFAYSGQSFDEKAEFAGTPTSNVYSGITITSVHNGTFNNGKSLTFDGVKTIAQIIVEYNNANPGNELTHSGPGATVPPIGSVTLSGGTLAVVNGDVVYRDIDGLYKRALADGSIKSRVAGIAELVEASNPKRIVRSNGFIAKTTGYPIGTQLFLSSATPGALTDIITSLQLGHVVGTNYILIGNGAGGGSGGGGNEYDAVVTDTPGFSFYPTTQQAIDAVPSGSHILVKKLETLTSTINTSGKRLKFTVAAPVYGWQRFLGNAEEQLVTFSQVPTSGTWKIEWNGQLTTDLAYNADASTVEAAINMLTGPGTPITVTGNYSTGFSFVWNDFSDVVEMTFVDVGVDEVQKIEFSAVPTDGTFRLEYDGQETVNIAFNDDASYIELALEELTNLTDVDVVGNFATGFFITFRNADGKQPQILLTLVNNTLTTNGIAEDPVSVNTSVDVPGAYPQQNLKNGITPVIISVVTLLDGNPVGPVTGIEITADDTMILGYGVIRNFINGVDLGGHTGIIIEANFQTTPNPVIGNASIAPGVDYRLEESLGFNRQTIRSVGYGADYASLDDAYDSAVDGDLILVLEDQSILENKVWDKNIIIDFLKGSRLLVDDIIAGDIITLGNAIQTRNMHLVVFNDGTYDAAYAFQGMQGHHTNLILELSGAGIDIQTGYRLDSGSFTVYIDGVIKINSATIADVITNDSGFLSHNIVIRDKDNGILHDLIMKRLLTQQTPLGVVDGVNTDFVLDPLPAHEDGILVMVDGIPRVKGLDWNLWDNDTVRFEPGYIPQLGQDVYVYYHSINAWGIPPGARAAPFDVYKEGVPFDTGVLRLDFGVGIDLVDLGDRKVGIDVGAFVGQTVNPLSVDIVPAVDDTRYLGEDIKGFKGLFLTDQTTGDIYRVEINNGYFQAVNLGPPPP